MLVSFNRDEFTALSAKNAVKQDNYLHILGADDEKHVARCDKCVSERRFPVMLLTFDDSRIQRKQTIIVNTFDPINVLSACKVEYPANCTCSSDIRLNERIFLPSVMISYLTYRNLTQDKSQRMHWVALFMKCLPQDFIDSSSMYEFRLKFCFIPQTQFNTLPTIKHLDPLQAQTQQLLEFLSLDGTFPKIDPEVGFLNTPHRTARRYQPKNQDTVQLPENEEDLLNMLDVVVNTADSAAQSVSRDTSIYKPMQADFVEYLKFYNQQQFFINGLFNRSIGCRKEQYQRLESSAKKRLAIDQTFTLFQKYFNTTPCVIIIPRVYVMPDQIKKLRDSERNVLALSIDYIHGRQNGVPFLNKSTLLKMPYTYGTYPTINFDTDVEIVRAIVVEPNDIDKLTRNTAMAALDKYYGSIFSKMGMNGLLLQYGKILSEEAAKYLLETPFHPADAYEKHKGSKGGLFLHFVRMPNLGTVFYFQLGMKVTNPVIEIFTTWIQHDTPKEPRYVVLRRYTEVAASKAAKSEPDIPINCLFRSLDHLQLLFGSS